MSVMSREVLFSAIATRLLEGPLEIKQLQELGTIGEEDVQDLLLRIMTCFFENDKREKAIKFSRTYFKKLSTWNISVCVKDEQNIIFSVLSKLLSHAASEKKTDIVTCILDELQATYSHKLSWPELQQIVRGIQVKNI